MYKVIIIYPSGNRVEEDEVFNTRSEAEDYALEVCGAISEGSETMYLSNSGDYSEADDADYEIIEVD